MRTDPTFWILARSSGLVAYLLLTASVLAGLVLKARPLGRSPKPAAIADAHRFLALLGLGAIGLHGSALVLDSTVRITPLALLVPGTTVDATRSFFATVNVGGSMTFNGTVPGPLMVVHEGDYVELTLKNPDTNMMQHNIDFHSSTGALGGGGLTLINPGEQVVLRWKATRPGVFVYHCAPGGPMIPWHVISGMNGAIMVLPRDGLKDGNGNPLKYDRVYYVGEQDFYVPRDEKGKFIWPGFGDNARVLKWISDRLDGRAEARETPIGLVPAKGALDVSGLKISDEAMETLTSVDLDVWAEEADLVPGHYEKFGERLPQRLWDEYAALVERLGAARSGKAAARSSAL